MTGYGGAGVGTSPCNELGCGVIFRQKKDGSDYTILHYFRDGSVVGDGYWPFGNGLTLSGSTIYGMTPSGGNTGGGVLFKINTDGTDYTVLHHFSMGGSVPVGSPTLSGSTLYGMTHEGATADGGEGAGVIFRVDTDGSDYAVLHRFPDKTVGEDGVFPRGPLTLSGSTLYGATFDSYPEGGGVLFKINTYGSGYTILHHFNDPFSGFYPSDDLTISGSTLYGTVLSVQKGSRTGGGIFKINTDGSGYAVLHHFNNIPDNIDYYMSGWGRPEPRTAPILVGETLYGITTRGGIYSWFVDSWDSYGGGIVYRVDMDGSNYIILHAFGDESRTDDGAYPVALTVADNRLYGMTKYGGFWPRPLTYEDFWYGYGTIFSLSLDQPMPTFSASGKVTSMGSGLAGVTIDLSGAATKTTTTGSDGKYSFLGLGNGVYTITPGKSGFTFSPESRSFNITGANVNGLNFVLDGGSLKVTLNPQAAVTAGARWKVDNGAWKPSGAKVSNLSAATHTVTFKPISGWITPAAQTITLEAGEAALATGTYQALGAADFSGTPTSGRTGLKVKFTDESTGPVKRWLWDFGDGGTSKVQNPVHTYRKPGTYTVTLTIKNGSSTSTKSKTDYITVHAAPKADFAASLTSGKKPLSVQFTDQSTGPVTSWLWKFGDATTSTDQNPSHTYTKAGSYTVKLKVTGPDGTNTKTSTACIQVLK